MKSALRTFEVLELFAERRQPLHLNEIYLALGYPQSSTTNLLKSMALLGYLNYNRATRTYLPTMRVNALGSWVASYTHADGRYRELVETLQRRTDETAVLMTQNDLFIQYLFVKAPDHEFKRPPIDGGMRMLVDACGGLALISRMSDRQIDTICRYTNYYEMAGSDRVSLDEMMREIRWIRQVGYAYSPKRPTPDVSAIAMALDADLHGIPLALGVGGMADRIERNKLPILTALREVITDFNESRRREMESETG
ncbi:IclR family transcriptional regulator [Sphingomonas sp. GB1N7]|uniref:IclR family transcriptional regulator n=1 Tax=Parasphingomonas caseinilytica TaxID=3096158 RepID=UPI002FCA0468